MNRPRRRPAVAQTSRRTSQATRRTSQATRAGHPQEVACAGGLRRAAGGLLCVRLVWAVCVAWAVACCMCRWPATRGG